MNNKTFTTYSLVFLVTVLPLASLGAVQRGGESSIDAQADRILREMGEYLNAAEEFSFRADVAYDEIVGEQMILFGGVAQISIRRPNRFNAEFNGDQRQTRVVFDGKTVTLFNVAKNLYAVTEAPPEIDGALDRLFELYGSSVPLADLVYADPYRTLIENAETGFVVGKHAVNGTRCHHLAFTQEGIDWQIWIEDGPRPVPRKLVITYIDEPGSPQYIAELSDWNFQPRLSDHYFTFRLPAGSDEIEFLPPQERTPPGEEEPPMNERQITSRVYRPLVFVNAALMVGGMLFQVPKLEATQRNRGSVRHSSRTGPGGNTRTTTTRTATRGTARRPIAAPARPPSKPVKSVPRQGPAVPG